MVCRSCGTEGRGSFCSHCGAPLVNEAFNVANKSEALSHQEQAAQPVQPPVSLTAEQKKSPNPLVAPKVRKARKARVRREKTPRPLVEIKMRQVFFPSLAFFLPLLYLFLDAFVLYNEVLYTNVEGGTVLSVLMAHLMDSAFASNPVSDVIAVTCGTDLPLWQSFTVVSALQSGNAAFLAPAAILLAAAVICVVCGTLVLFSAGRVLRLRPIADAVIAGGVLSSVAPLLADVAYRLHFVFQGGTAAADAAMPMFTLSVEAMLLQALSVALLLPAARAMRRAAAGEGVYVTLPYRVLAKSTFLARMAACFTGTLAALLPFVLLALPICENGTLLELCFDTIEPVVDNLSILKGIFGGIAFDELMDATLLTLLLPVVPLMALWLLLAIFKLVRMLLVSTRRVATSARRRRSFKRLGITLRRIPAVLLSEFVTCGGVFFFLSLLLTGLKAHLHLDAVQDTLTLLYLVIAFVKLNVRLYTVGVLAAVASLVLGTVAGNCAKAFVMGSLAAHREE